MRAKILAENDELSEEALREEFLAFIGDAGFPCLGAHAALNSGAVSVAVCEELGSSVAAAQLAPALAAFAQGERSGDSFATFVALFREPRQSTEEEFEGLLWKQLRELHRIDAATDPWPAATDPADPFFSFGFAGVALYIVGLHPGSSRFARQFPFPALVFNPHEQFERLRREGKWERMQKAIRSRDVALQGSFNPMLSNFGERSEARQYSGRQVSEDWQAPFHVEAASANSAPARCPFAH